MGESLGANKCLRRPQNNHIHTLAPLSNIFHGLRDKEWYVINEGTWVDIMIKLERLNCELMSHKSPKRPILISIT